MQGLISHELVKPVWAFGLAGYCWGLLGVVEYINRFIVFLLKRGPKIGGALDPIKPGTVLGPTVVIK